jgi:hypothetical protein
MEIYTRESLRSQYLFRDVAEMDAVMRGLDPRIHHSSQDDGSPGQARR